MYLEEHTLKIYLNELIFLLQSVTCPNLYIRSVEIKRFKL